ncbi:MAG: acyl-CoA dehydrogenase family protein [Pseudomonadales bacterium]
MQHINGTDTPLARAQAIAPSIEHFAELIDETRELPRDVVDSMVNAGLFRLLVPKSLGGEEMDILDYLDVVQTIAYADGSAGWCLNQGAVFATTSSRAPRHLAEEVWGDPNTVVANGPPQGPQSVPIDRGYRLTGKWAFSSGCRHANWIAAVSGGSGQPPRLHLVPREDVDFVDVWDVQGLRGTGSFSFTANDLFVPESRAMLLDVEPLEAGPLYVIPQHLLFACGFGCVALGVARAGLDATIELASDKRPRFVGKTLAHDPVVQSQIGKAEATWRSAKALLHESMGSVWNSVKSTGSISVEERIHLRMAGTHAIRQSANVVDIAYNLSGSGAIFSSAKIQRRFQDAHVITQQVQGRESHYQTVGEYFLGLDPTGPVF